MMPVREKTEILRLTIAARRSALARLQAQLVAQALQQAQPALTINFHFRDALGDQRPDAPLWQMPEKGVFTEDLRADLLSGVCDLVVHSWKDLPLEEQPQTVVAATLPRADERDLLLLRNDRWAAVERTGVLSLLTSSPRRAQNLRTFLPGALPANIHTINFASVRGAIPTRVQKMWRQAADGLVLAKAALDRLLAAEAAEFAETKAELRAALLQCRWLVLPLTANPTAPAQGALAIEIVRDRADLRALLAAVNCTETFAAVQREREILRRHGGGCHQAIGVSVLARPYGVITSVCGLDESGRELAELTLQPQRPRPPRLERALLWPLQLSDNKWFTRTPCAVAQPDVNIALWIARAEALPPEWRIPAAQIVWTSGLETWRRLAARGVWVNGSAESLGERETPQLEWLTGAALNWRKLSHAEGNTDSLLPPLPTYHLTPHEVVPDLRGREYFYWTSGSRFRRALTLFPWLRTKTHFCGPGQTQQALMQIGIEPHIFLNHQQWLREIAL